VDKQLFKEEYDLLLKIVRIQIEIELYLHDVIKHNEKSYSVKSLKSHQTYDKVPSL